MGYFDGLVAGSFKRDAKGREIFFLRGLFGKGCVVPSEEDGARLRRYLKLYYVGLIAGAILVVTVGGEPFEERWFWTLGAFTALAAVAAWPLRLRTRHWEVVRERMTLKEQLSASAKANSAASLWVWIFISLLMVVGGVVGLIYADDSTVGFLGAVIMVVFFGGWLGVLMWMLRARQRG